LEWSGVSYDRHRDPSRVDSAGGFDGQDGFLYPGLRRILRFSRCGINRKRAFESFVQLDKTRNKKTGFGLGLAIVKRAIEWHGGEVVILDSPLGGARFAVSWPAEALP
jgi:hypothetical protein